ncbi:MAG: DUF2752 domain-containing protein [Phycisphaerae bacterium]|jgi:hypothetical protein|nr:DUF2752 domain-containing protein [Phycisphaerae bacterium]
MEETNEAEEFCPQVKTERSRRIQALVVALVALALLAVAFVLKPSQDGVGTHRQLGLPKCGWILAADLPCPTCGMTTAWSHTVRGELPTAFTTQPMGMILAFVAIVIAIGGFISAITGYSFAPLFYRFPPSKIFILSILLAGMAWGYKILLHKGIL